MKTLLIIPFVLLLTTPLVYALTPYQSGYQHGLKDPELKEIEAGVNHTKAFNQGYIDGWCSLPGNGPGSGSDSDKGTFNCGQDATK